MFDGLRCLDLIVALSADRRLQTVLETMYWCALVMFFHLLYLSCSVQRETHTATTNQGKSCHACWHCPASVQDRCAAAGRPQCHIAVAYLILIASLCPVVWQADVLQLLLQHLRHGLQEGMQPVPGHQEGQQAAQDPNQDRHPHCLQQHTTRLLLYCCVTL